MPWATSRLSDVANGGLRAIAVCVALCIALQSVALQPRSLATEPSLASANAQAISAGDSVPKFELDVLPILNAISIVSRYMKTKHFPDVTRRSFLKGGMQLGIGGLAGGSFSELFQLTRQAAAAGAGAS